MLHSDSDAVDDDVPINLEVDFRTFPQEVTEPAEEEREINRVNHSWMKPGILKLIDERRKLMRRSTEVD